MNRLVRISFLTLKISSIIFIVFFIIGMLVALVLGKNTLSIATFWDVLIYTVLLNISTHLYRKSILAGEQPGKVSAVILAGMLGPLIFYSCLYAYEVVLNYLANPQGRLANTLFVFLIFLTLAASGIILFNFVLHNLRHQSVKSRDLPVK